MTDGHYDMVMKARAQAGTGNRLYFAYSTILDPEAFAEWKAQHSYDSFALGPGVVAEATGVELTYDFMSRWWGGRVAGLADATGKSVWGKLFTVTEKDWPIVQHKEGAITGMCVERVVRVKTPEGEVEAWAFTTAPARRQLEGPLSENFKVALVRGAQAAGLPESWIASLR